jgi:hypothetical protein
MKTTLLLLLAVLFLARPVHAAHGLVVDATLTEKHANVRTRTWSPEPVTVGKGITAIFHMGGFDVKTAPVLNERGQVVIPIFVFQGPSRNEKVVSRPTLTTRLGVKCKVESDSFALTIVITRAK